MNYSKLNASLLFNMIIILFVSGLNKIKVNTQNGIVTLAGTVNNMLAKDRAVKIVESIKGVRSIVNRIDVEPLIKRSDDDIKTEVENALLNDPATETYEIDVKVKDGAVTLSGEVQSWAEKELCATVAEGVPGVSDLNNEISIRYKTDRPDREIKEEISERLSNDVWLNGTLIDVNVDNSRVSLTGTVGSLSEKRRAESKAWVAGVKSVDLAGLKIQWWAQNRMKRSRNYSKRDDADIKEAVKDAFLYDPRVKFFNPEVNVKTGTVTLRGIVDNLKAKRAAEQDARNTIGVWRVKNHLKVQPAEIPSDKTLKKRVDNALHQDPFIDRYEVKVDASNGIIYLSGIVHTSFEKYHVENIVSGVKGVTGLVNNIDYEHKWTWKPDWEIKEDVKDQLAWSTLVDQDKIKVKVDKGVVTLTGEVYNWSAYNASERNAYEGGAKDVNNNLTVKFPDFGPFYPYDYWGYPYLPHF
ncbi:MAG: BON domain-containing protein [Calditrichaceae bacterium]